MSKLFCQTVMEGVPSALPNLRELRKSVVMPRIKPKRLRSNEHGGKRPGVGRPRGPNYAGPRISRPPTEIVCAQCKTVFVKTGKGRLPKFCSDTCRVESGVIAQGKGGKLNVSCDAVCNICEKTFTYFRVGTSPVKTCSDECRKVRDRKQGQESYHRKGKFRPPHIEKTCVICGNQFFTKLYITQTCSLHCGGILASRKSIITKAENRKPKSENVCLNCHALFIPGKMGGFARAGLVAHGKYCSQKCVREHGIKIGKSERRVRLKEWMGGPERDGIDRTLVLQRDRYVCYLCDIATRTDVPARHPESAQVDHIIPLSKGGKHAYWNVACACRGCNMKKGNKIIDRDDLPERIRIRLALQSESIDQ